jgi:hypothetical protein
MPSKLHYDQLSILLALSTSPNPPALHPLGYFIIQILIWPLFTLRKADTVFFCHRRTTTNRTTKKFLKEYCFVDFIQDSKLAHVQLLVNHLQSPLTLHQLLECAWYIASMYLHCFWYNSSNLIDWKNTLIFANEWFLGPGKFSLKSMLQNRRLHLPTSLLV